MTKKAKRTHRPFYRRKFFLWIISVGVVVAVILLAFRLSPVPGALIIKSVFNRNGSKVLAAMENFTPDKPVISVKDQSYRADDPDALLDVYYPQSVEGSATRLPVVIWTHGGAWLSGDKTDDTPYFKLLAAAGYVVIAPNYTLAPHKSYPYQLHQLNEAHSYAIKYAERFHVDMSKVVLAGDSAGAQLSAQFGALITNPTYAKEVGLTPALQSTQLKGLVLNCGIYKMEGLTHPNPTLPKIVGWGNDVTVWAYGGTRDFSDPVFRQMSAYYHVTDAYPATYISGGNADLLTKAQSEPFAAKLRALNVEVSELFYPDTYTPPLAHEYQFDLNTHAAQGALAQTITFLSQQTR